MALPEFLMKTSEALGAAPIGGGLAGSETLEFTEQHQEQDQWCWAAVSVSVSHFYDAASTWTQCDLVNAELNRSDCCWNGSTSQCDRPWNLNSPLSRTQNLNTMDNSAALFADLISEIDNRRPIGCRIGWFAGGGHFVVIHGYSTSGGQWVTVGDPFYGPSTYSYDGFCSAYRNSGEWTHTYNTQA